MAKRQQDRTFVKTIASMSRMPNSTNGNPRWRFECTDGSIEATAPDTSVAYEVVWSWEGKTFRFTADGKGIYKAEPVDRDPETGWTGIAEES